MKSGKKRKNHRTSKKVGQPTVSLCMIIKNEEKFLGQCLASVSDLVDEMIIVDTGSTDRSLEIAAQFRAKIYHYTWDDDFAAARNVSLSHAASDWILALDADEEIDDVNKYKIRKLLRKNSAQAFFLNLRSPIPENGTGKAFVNAFPRLFRNRPEIYYESPIHEHIMFSLERLGCQPEMTDVIVHHYGYGNEKEGKTEKLERNLRILEKHLQKEPDSGISLFHLGETQALLKHLDEAIAAFQQALTTKNLPDYLRAITHQNLASAYLNQGKFYEMQIECEHALRLKPELLTPRLFLGYSAYLQKNFAAAIDRFSDYLNESRRQKLRSDRYFEHEPNFGFVFTCLGDCHRNLQNADLAENYYRKAIEKGSRYSGTFLNLARILFDTRRKLEAIKFLENFREWNQENEQINQLLAQTCFQVANELIPVKEWNRAENYLNQARTLAPEIREIYYNLAVVHIKQNKYELAAENFKRVLELRPNDEEIKRKLKLLKLKSRN